MVDDSVPKAIVVLISGSGTNLQALLDAQSTPALPNARITQVISNRRGAFGLERASKASVPTAVLNLKTWQKENPSGSREDYDEVLARMVLAGADGRADEVGAAGAEGGAEEAGESGAADQGRRSKPDLVVLAGFMHILSPRFLDTVGSDVPCINLHPALPGAFDGAHAIERAWAAHEKGELHEDTTGAMVHEVVAEVDRGNPIVVEEIPIQPGWKVGQLEERIHEVEHRIIVEGAKIMLEKGVQLQSKAAVAEST